MSFIFIFVLLTVLALIFGLVIMAVGGTLNKKFSNKLMALRVIFQALAIVALGVAYYLVSSG